MSDDGGPAFPRPKTRWDDGAPGMTVLDYFAAKAMQAHLGDGASEDEKVAGWAYDAAEAMLAESKRRKGLK